MKKTTKKCTKCNTIKKKLEFNKDKSTHDKLRPSCKICKRRDDTEYRRTKDGLISNMYGGQRTRSKQKGYPMPSYTKADLTDWLFAQKLFHHLFHLWEVSGFDKMLTPSIDRIDNYAPYSFSNIQLMTWIENKKKGQLEHKLGTAHSDHKPVSQYTKSGSFIAEYVSMCEALRQTGICDRGISSCCKGRTKTAGGYIWRFTIKESK